MTETPPARSKLISKELLSTEEILQRGVNETDVGAFRMKKFKEAFTLDKWISIEPLRALTFDTHFISISAAEAKSFLSYCRYKMQSRTKDPITDFFKVYEKNKQEIDDHIQGIKDKINKVIEDSNWTECGFFAKFNSRSPKDVHEYNGESQSVVDMFYNEMDKLKQSDRSAVDMNDAFLASFIARAKLMRMTTSDDVIDTFSRSFRAVEDLAGTLRLGDEHVDISIALRKWNDAVPLNGHGEFRCFVHNGELNAITQYVSCVWFKGLFEQGEAIKQRIVEFYESKVRQHIPMDSFVIDFLVTDIVLQGKDEDEEEKGLKEKEEGEIFIIELNPFYGSAGAGLFDWREDRELFLNGPCEIRIRNELDPKLEEYFHASWMRSYEKYKGISSIVVDAEDTFCGSCSIL